MILKTDDYDEEKLCRQLKTFKSNENLISNILLQFDKEQESSYV
jgi:hypothetical protein